MLIGLMADTHDRLPLIKKAIDVLNEYEVELVLHAGDYVAPFVIPYLARLNAKVIGVFGNCDGDHFLLLKRATETKGHIELRGRFAEIMCSGLRIALLHGDDEELLNSLISCQGYDLIVHGHLHRPLIRTAERTLIICPGEVCGYLYGRSTVGLFNTDDMKVNIIDVMEEEKRGENR